MRSDRFSLLARHKNSFDMARKKGDGKGQQGGGRKKGTPNKVTAEVKELIASFIDGNWKNFESAYKEIKDPERKCKIYLELLPYVTPKLASVEDKVQVTKLTMEQELSKISGEPTRE